MDARTCLSAALGLLLTANGAEAACEPLPQNKIGFQLYNMLGAMIPPDKMPATAAGPYIAYYVWEYDDDPAPFKSAEIAYRYLRCEK